MIYIDFLFFLEGGEGARLSILFRFVRNDRNISYQFKKQNKTKQSVSSLIKKIKVGIKKIKERKPGMSLGFKA